MIAFRESVTQSGMQEALPAAPDDSDAARPMQTESRAESGRRAVGLWLFAIWVLVSLVWTGTVAADVYYRATAQADMSQEVERDLDLVSCEGRDCSKPNRSGLPENRSGPQEKWANIAATYVHFGYVSILEWTMLPPALLLVAGIGGTLMLRRRRIATRNASI